MRKIQNPYVRNRDYNCFACSPSHKAGLRMDFFEEGDQVGCRWIPTSQFEGYANILHGGIQATLLDEIASWTIQVKKGSSGVTGRMNVRYLKPVFINQPFILLMANIIFEKMNRVTVKADLFDHKEVLCTSAEVDYYVFPEDVARKKYNYPGYAKFFGD